MARREERGMKEINGPKKHFEKNEGKLGSYGEVKYASEMGNPEDLKKSTEALQGYVKKHKMKY